MLGKRTIADRSLRTIALRSFFVTAGLFSLLGSQAFAATGLNNAATSSQTANGFLISPVITEISVPKGTSQVIQVSVANPAKVSVKVQVVVNDFEASTNESGDPKLLLNNSGPKPKDDFTSLVSKSFPIITLGPQGRTYIPITISVPANASAGGYYGAIRFVPASSSNQGNIGLTASVASLFLITVPGNLTEQLSLVQFSAAQNNQPQSFFTSGKVSVLTRLNNTGDIQVQPFGTVEVKNMFGKFVTSYQFNNTSPRGNVLPSSIRKFIDPLPKRTWFGYYTIQASLAYQQGSGNIIEATASFWYLPVWFVITVLAVVALLVIDLIYIFIVRPKRRHKHHKK